MRRISALALTYGFLLSCVQPSEPRRDFTLHLTAEWTAPTAEVAVGTTLPTAPRVRVTTPAGQPVSGARVVFVQFGGFPGAGVVSAVSSDADGYAEMAEPWVLGPSTGVQRVTAMLPVGTAQNALTFEITAVPGPAASLRALLPLPVSIAIGDSARPQVEVRDQYQNRLDAPGPIALATSDTGVAVVKNGWVVAVGSGITRVVASLDALSDTLGSIGVPSPPPQLDTLSVEALRGYSIAITDNRVLFTGDFDVGVIGRYDIALGTELAPIAVGSGSLAVVSVPGRNEVWASLASSNDIAVFDATTGALLRTITLPGTVLRMLPNSAGTAVFAAGYHSGRIYRVDAATGTFTISSPVASAINGLALSANQSVLYATSIVGQILYEIDANSLSVTRSLSLPGSLQEVVLHQTSNRLIVIREHHPIVAVALGSLTIAAAGPIVTGAYGATFTSDDRWLVVASLEVGIRVLDAFSLEVVGSLSASRPRRAVLDAQTGALWINQETVDRHIRLTVTPP